MYIIKIQTGSEHELSLEVFLLTRLNASPRRLCRTCKTPDDIEWCGLGGKRILS